MIRKLRESDLNQVMQLWLQANMETHYYIPERYWLENYEQVKESISRAEVYVYEDGPAEQIYGFLGLTGDYIAGIFVRRGARSQGVGKKLIDYAKSIQSTLQLSVYQKNKRAIRFYQREGFIIQNEALDTSTNEKEYLMQWAS